MKFSWKSRIALLHYLSTRFNWRGKDFISSLCSLRTLFSLSVSKKSLTMPSLKPINYEKLKCRRKKNINYLRTNRKKRLKKQRVRSKNTNTTRSVSKRQETLCYWNVFVFCRFCHYAKASHLSAPSYHLFHQRTYYNSRDHRRFAVNNIVQVCSLLRTLVAAPQNSHFIFKQ